MVIPVNQCVPYRCMICSSLAHQIPLPLYTYFDISKLCLHTYMYELFLTFSTQIDFSQVMAVPKNYEQDLKDIVARDPLHPLFEQDKEIIWRFK